MNFLLKLSAVRLADMIKKGEVSSLEVVDAHIDQIRKVNPQINAVVKERFDLARAEAKAVDEKGTGPFLAQRGAYPKRGLSPFHGVPCTIKECYALKGMPWTSGLVARKGVVAEKSCTSAARLVDAGFIPLGVTNLSELCMWMETNNKVYGRTNNPYDLTRMVGGSSGGEGAIIAAGGSPVGLAGDIGGSIRMPAFFNGVFGHKPTGGTVPVTGHFPNPANEAHRYLTIGPICRRAEDLMPALKVTAGPDGVDKWCLDIKLGDPDSVKINELTVFVVDGIKVSGDLFDAREKAAVALAKMGAKIKRVEVEGFKKSFDIWSYMMSAAGGPAFKELLGEGRAINSYWQLLKFIFGRSPHTFPALGLAILEGLLKFTPKRAKKFVEYGHAFKKELVELIGPKGVLLYPPYPTVAPKHNKPLFPPFSWVYTAIFNVMEFPVTQVPLGLNKDGLPLGVQVAGVHGNDHSTIAVAIELEKIFGGWVPPDAGTC